jgi:hypothetical protein
MPLPHLYISRTWCEIYWFQQPELQYLGVRDMDKEQTHPCLPYVRLLDFYSAPSVQACSRSER